MGACLFDDTRLFGTNTSVTHVKALGTGVGEAGMAQW